MHIIDLWIYTESTRDPFLSLQKIEAATYMLTNTNLHIHSIAEKLNFYSEFHFSRVFKQYTGFAPTVYRKNYVHNKTLFQNQSD